MEEGKALKSSPYARRVLRLLHRSEHSLKHPDTMAHPHNLNTLTVDEHNHCSSEEKCSALSTLPEYFAKAAEGEHPFKDHPEHAKGSENEFEGGKWREKRPRS